MNKLYPVLRLTAVVSVLLTSLDAEPVRAAALVVPEVTHGEPRVLPEPETRRPALDENLPGYVPCRREWKQVLSGSAPPIMPALVQDWIVGFRKQQPGVSFDLGPPWLPPQGRLDPALQSFLEGDRDFAFLSREPSVEDMQVFLRHHGHPLWMIPVATGSWRHFGFVDAVGVIVNIENPLASLDFAQLDALLSESRLRGHPPVTHWGELGVMQWAGKPINVVGAAAWRSEESARALTIRRQVMEPAGAEGNGRWRRDLDAGVYTEAQVPEQVATDLYAIGFTGLGHLVPGVRVLNLAVEPGAPPVPADGEHVASGEYPLARQLYLLVDPAAGYGLNPALAEFARYILSSKGQQAVADQGVFIPLRENHAAKYRGQIEALQGACD
ncbi:MAG TPA: substrate-binding domain-containing protein [Xanthomonadaceae bacterium]|nr:substrate-binding domain-containing protein [Xanthomonadaceae bacterium]